MLEDKDLVSIQEVRTKVEKAYAAWLKYRTYSQEQVDAIVERTAAAGRANAERLAALAVAAIYGLVMLPNLLRAPLGNYVRPLMASFRARFVALQMRFSA